MIEVRFHGRGGQGSVIASGILAEAAFREGKSIQSFPYFGVERRGAPVTAFTRIDDKYIRIRHYIYKPDCIVVLEPSLVEATNIVDGLKKEGLILINSDWDPDAFSFKKNFKIATVNASDIATRLGLGSKTAPIVNTAILGAFAKFTNIVTLDSVLAAIKERVPMKREENIAAAKEAYEKVKF
ncbi:MAG: 2-oxoacid:acceptor oxidoreductase family protein [Candidatus Omnitrophica bacterium]|nr:2-oxoacid:acceptor oxidoreductase family protein [Candidatus Omnitrophota bacterium]